MEPRHPSGEPWGVKGRDPAPTNTPYVQPEGDTVAYVLAVEYPEGVDYFTLSDYSSCTLSVFAMQKKIVSVAAGEGSPISVATDRNRLAGGHLYSDSFIKDSTVIFKDGKELFRYAGREMLRGFAVAEEGVYTLGQRVSAEGFSLRLNGIELFSRSSGTIIGEKDFTSPSEGALFLAENDYSFGYWTPDGDFYIVRGLSSEVVQFQDKVVKVLDIRYIDNEYYIVALRDDGCVGVYPSGGRKIIFDINEAPSLYSARLVSCGDAIYLKVHFHLGERGERLYVWGMRGEIIFRAESYINLYMEEGRLAYYAAPGDPFSSEYAAMIPLCSEGDRLFRGQCAVLKDGHQYAAVTPSGDLMYPYLLKDGRRLAIAVNGYLIDLEVIP